MEKVQGHPRDMRKGSRTTWWEKVWMEKDPEALVSHLGVWRIPPEDAAPSSRPGEPRLLPEPMESTETLPNADR